MTRWRRRIGGVAAIIIATAGGCASRPDAEATVSVLPLDQASYAASVHAVVERRCGSIDCHGQLPRGLRVYGAGGLRLPNDAGLAPALGSTSDDEIAATYASIVGLEPERTNVLALRGRRGEDAYRLLFLTKPLALERHRGGVVLKRGEPAERCLSSWLLGSVEERACDVASEAE